MDEACLVSLWRFVRGDLPVREFEAWVYAEKTLEEALGSALHWQVISADYRNADAVSSVRDQLRAALHPQLRCLCPTIPDMDAIPMGGDGLDRRFFATVREVRSHGGDLWWLYLSRCQICGQDWMVAQEERIYDDYLLKRLSGGEADGIVNDNYWPGDFLTYEKVLETARRLGSPGGFIDRHSPALIESVRDLKRSKPEITVTEIARLLGVEEAHARELIRAV